MFWNYMHSGLQAGLFKSEKSGFDSQHYYYLYIFEYIKTKFDFLFTHV